jgi:hypothetical protein
MATLRLGVRRLELPDLDDEAVGQHLVEMLRKAAHKGKAAPAALVLREGGLDLIDVSGVHKSAVPLPAFLAGLTRSTPPDGGSEVVAVGLIGTMGVRDRRTPKAPSVPVAVVFLEWPDCRWWYWRAFVREDGLDADSETVSRAVDGDSLPGHLGRWWSLGRRRKMRVDLRSVEPETEPEPETDSEPLREHVH